ncbi:MAG: hypothetical protein C4332_12385 [Meiothermus sp.]
MIRLRQLKNDILPITAFRTQLVSILKRLEGHKTPLVLTHNGRAAAVLLSVEAYEQMVENLEVAKATIPSMMAVIKGEVEGIEGAKIKKEAKK